MTIPNRTVSIKNVFASTANTNIPSPPAPGVSYRNTATTAAEIGEGWPFKEIVDSAKFNQAMYEYTTICQQLEKYGFLPWSPNTDYLAGGCALGSDGNIYQAKVNTGPSSTALDPVSDTSHSIWDLFYYSSFTANRALISNANGKVTASSVTANELSYLSGVSSAIQTQINTKANNNAVVHLTGDESISGVKNFNSPIYRNATLGTSVGTSLIVLNEGNAKGTSTIDTYYVANEGGNFITRMVAYNNTAQVWGYIETRVYDNGDVYYVVGREGNATIQDTVNSILFSQGKSLSQNGYAKLSNGLIIQWMLTPNIQSNGTTITFPTPFTTTNYAICFNPFRASALNESSTTVTEYTTTTCKVWGRTYEGGNINCPCFAIAIGY